MSSMEPGMLDGMSGASSIAITDATATDVVHDATDWQQSVRAGVLHGTVPVGWPAC